MIFSKAYQYSALSQFDNDPDDELNELEDNLEMLVEDSDSSREGEQTGSIERHPGSKLKSSCGGASKAVASSTTPILKNGSLVRFQEDQRPEQDFRQRIQSSNSDRLTLDNTQEVRLNCMTTLTGR